MRYRGLLNNDYHRNQQFLINQNGFLDEELEQPKQMWAVKVIMRAKF